MQFAFSEDLKRFSKAKYRINRSYTPQVRTHPTRKQISIYNKAIATAQEPRSLNVAAMAAENRIFVGVRPNTMWYRRDDDRIKQMLQWLLSYSSHVIPIEQMPSIFVSSILFMLYAEYILHSLSKRAMISFLF